MAAPRSAWASGTRLAPVRCAGGATGREEADIRAKIRLHTPRRAWVGLRRDHSVITL